MSLTNPYLIGLLPQRQQATQGDLKRRIQVIERGTGAGAASGSAGVGDATTLVKGKVQLAGDIGGTAAAVTVKKLTNLATTAMTDRLVSDIVHGDLQQYLGVGNAGLRWNIQHGTTASPVTTEGPTLSVTRKEQFVTTTQGAESAWYSAIRAVNVGTTSTLAQPVGISGVATSTADAPWPFSATKNTDACGVIGIASVQGSGTGYGIGAHFEGHTNSTAGSARGIEAQVRNASGVDGVFNTAGPSNIHGVWVVLNNRAGGGGIEMGNPANVKWNVAISFKSQNGGPASDASIQDDGNATHSYLCNGTHDYCFASGTTAGKFLVGLTTTAFTTQSLLRSCSDSNSALIVRANSATQAVNVLEVHDNTLASALSVSAGGNVVVDHGKLLVGLTSSAVATNALFQPTAATNSALILKGHATQSVNIFQTLDTSSNVLFSVGPTGAISVGGAAGAGHIQFGEQSGAPATPAANNARLYAADNGSGTTVLRYVDSAGAIVTLGAAGAGGYISSVANTNTIEHTVSGGSQLTSIIPTTATPQVTGLGIGLANTAGLAVGRLPADASTVTGFSATTAGATVVSTAAGNDAFSIYNSSSGATPRFKISIDATSNYAGMLWSNGTTIDVRLWRSAGSTLSLVGASGLNGAAHLAMSVGGSSIKFDAGAAVNFISAANAGGGLKIGNATNDKLAWWGSTPVVRPADYTVTTSITTHSDLRSFDEDTVTLGQLAQVVATLIKDDQSTGFRGGSVT